MVLDIVLIYHVSLSVEKAVFFGYYLWVFFPFLFFFGSMCVCTCGVSCVI